MRWFSSAVAVLLVLACCGPVLAGKQFRWKFQPGETYTLDMTQKMNSTVLVQGKTVDVPMEMNMGMQLQVDAADAEKFTLTQTFQRVALKTRPPRGEVAYDSASIEPAEGPAAQFERMLKPMVGAKFVEVRSPRGKMLEFKPNEEALKALDTPLTRQIMSPEALKDLASRLQPEMPEGEIEAGATWTHDGELKMPLGTMKFSSTYTYEGEDAAKKLDKFKIAMQLELVPAGLLGAGLKMTDQKHEGVMYFDHAAGRLVESSIQQAFTLEGKVFNETVKHQTSNETTVKLSPVAAK